MRAEQERVREYLRRKGTLLAPGEVHDRVRAAFLATAERLAGVSSTEARQRPEPGEWCVQEIVDHLVESHRPGVAELRELLRGERPPNGPIPASLQSADPWARPWAELLAELAGLQRQILTLLVDVPSDFQSAARAPVVLVTAIRGADGTEQTLPWVEEVDWKAYAVIFRVHEIEHARQAARALERVRG